MAKYGYPYSALCSAFNPSKVHTHSSEHTHMLRQGAGEQFGFGALLKGTSVVVLRVERERCTFTPPPTIPAGPETFTRLRVRLSNH